MAVDDHSRRGRSPFGSKKIPGVPGGRAGQVYGRNAPAGGSFSLEPKESQEHFAIFHYNVRLSPHRNVPKSKYGLRTSPGAGGRARFRIGGQAKKSPTRAGQRRTRGEDLTFTQPPYP